MEGLGLIAKYIERDEDISRREFFKRGTASAAGFLISYPEVNKHAEKVLVYPYDPIPKEKIAKLSAQANREYKKISKSLGRDYNFGKIKIMISNSFENIEAFFRVSQLRGTIRMPSPYVLNGVYATAHELTHIVADQSPVAAYFTEGLATNIQYNLGESKDSSPNLESNLHLAFRRTGLVNGQLKVPMSELVSMESFHHKNKKHENKMHLHYQAASFVEYLINVWFGGNTRRFMPLYEKGGFQKHFGKNLEQLEKEWLEFVKNFAAKK